MKRNVLLLAMMAVAMLFLTPHNVEAQCPADTNDLGICDTLYVETFDCDQIYEATAGYDSVRVAIYVTHDSNTIWYYNRWVQDSIAAFGIPLNFWKEDCADSIIFPTYDDWNNKVMDPDSAKFNRSMFRHLVDPQTGDTVYNRFALMHEAGLADWEVYTNIVSHDSGHVFVYLFCPGEARRWWEGEKTLLATLTFLVYLGPNCDSTAICLDSTFWPPGTPFRFLRYDAVDYIPRHFLPVCDTIYRLIHDVGISSIQSPPSSIPPGVPVTPRATSKNFGDYSESFYVICRIDSAGIPIDTNIQFVTSLPPGDSIQITFPSWTPCACPGNVYLVTFYTSLMDSNPSNDVRSVQTKTHIQASFAPTQDTTITSGEYWFHDFTIPPNVTVEFLGSVTFNVENQFLLDTLGTLKGYDVPLVINHLSTLEPLKILGNLIDTSLTPPDTGAEVVIRSLGSIILGGDTTYPQAKVMTSGPLFIGDPYYTPRLAARTVTSYFTGEDSANMPPACNITAISYGDRYFSFDFIEQDPFVDQIIKRTIYFGNGDSLVNPPPLSYRYDSVGVYQVVYKIMDADSNVSTSTLTLVVPEGKVYQGYAFPFTDTSLVKPVGVPFSFTTEKGPCDSVEWHFGDGSASNSLSTTHAFELPGKYEVRLSVWSGNDLYVVKMNVVVTLQGAKIAMKQPPAPDIAFPCLPSKGLLKLKDLFEPLEVPKLTKQQIASPCSLCDLQEPPLGWRVVWGGNVWIWGNPKMDTLRPNPYVAVTAFDTAIIVFRPGFTVEAPIGDSLSDWNGIFDLGFAAVTLHGQIVVCGANFKSRAGANGKNRTYHGCPVETKGGPGGAANFNYLDADSGKITYCGQCSVGQADGGNGGKGIAAGWEPLPHPCTDGCDAKAWGGMGGMGGGGILNYTENPNDLTFDTTRNFSIVFSGSAKGGNGGMGIADASDGNNCPDCEWEAGDGGYAYAEGGPGGDAFWYFMFHQRPDTSIIWAWEKGCFKIQGSWEGGDGGNAESAGGTGGHGSGDCCTPVPEAGTNGGDGGNADAYGGEGGEGMSQNGNNGEGNATCGKGGNGSNGNPPGRGGEGGRAWDDVPPPDPEICPRGAAGPWCPAAPPVLPAERARLAYCQLPPDFCPYPPCSVSLPLYVADSLVGQIPVRFIGPGEYPFSYTDTILYWNNEGDICLTPGGMVISLKNLPTGDTARGFEANVTDFCGTAECVVLEGYWNDEKVVDTMDTQGCEEVLLRIQHTEGLDSVILWGHNFSFWCEDIFITFASFLCGDANGDEVVNIADAIYLINYLFIAGPAPEPLEAGDANSDGKVDIADVVYLINYLFIGGPRPCEGKGTISSGSELELYKGKEPAQIGFSSPQISADGIFNVPVMGKFDTDLAAIQLEIKYDPEEIALLEPALTPTTQNLTIYSYSNEGIYKIGLLDLNGKHYISSGTDALVDLRIKGSDWTSLEITEAILVDRDAHKIPVNIISEMKKSEEDFTEEKSAVPQEFSLSQNYPNPFNPETEISYALPTDCHVKLKIYNIAGRKVKTLVDQHQTAGYKTVYWNGKDDKGKEIATGVYFYRIQAGDFSQSRKMVLVK